MKSGPQCTDCLKGLAGRIATAAARGNTGLQEQALKAELAALSLNHREGESVPTRVATKMLRAAAKVTGNKNPFYFEKEEEFKKGSKAAEALLGLSPRTLPSLIAHSAAGNRIDFFRDLEEVEKEWREETAAPSLDDTGIFVEEVKRVGSVLILADNTGELPFDLPLLNLLREMGIKTTYAVKGLPSQNDLTREDVTRFGVGIENLVDTGTDWVGCDLMHVGAEFKEAWRSAELIFSKGMANLETLSEYPEELLKKRIFFALVVKCQPVADYLGLPMGHPAIFDGRRLFCAPE